jgi:hypothetical protein
MPIFVGQRRLPSSQTRTHRLARVTTTGSRQGLVDHLPILYNGCQLRVHAHRPADLQHVEDSIHFEFPSLRRVQRNSQPTPYYHFLTKSPLLTGCSSRSSSHNFKFVGPTYPDGCVSFLLRSLGSIFILLYRHSKFITCLSFQRGKMARSPREWFCL